MQQFNVGIEVFYTSFVRRNEREKDTDLSKNIVFVKSFVLLFLRHNE